MRITKNKIIKWILGFIFFLSNFFILYIYIWINNIIKLVIIICILFTIVYYIEIILIEINFIFEYIYKYYNKIRKIYTIFSFVYIFIYPLEIFTISFNLGIYETNFLKDCPYTINNLDYRLHLERRCELYNINNNSRYSYQYICSYDSSKDFAYKDFNKNIPKILTKIIKPKYVICVPVKSLKSKNKIIKLFLDEYYDSENYYCSRTDKPKNSSYATMEDCNNKLKNNFIFIFFVMFILQGIYFQMYYKSLEDFNVNIKDNLVEESNSNINTINQLNNSLKEIRISNNILEKPENLIENKKDYTNGIITKTSTSSDNKNNKNNKKESNILVDEYNHINENEIKN